MALLGHHVSNPNPKACRRWAEGLVGSRLLLTSQPRGSESSSLGPEQSPPHLFSSTAAFPHFLLQISHHLPSSYPHYLSPKRLPPMDTYARRVTSVFRRRPPLAQHRYLHACPIFRESGPVQSSRFPNPAGSSSKPCVRAQSGCDG